MTFLSHSVTAFLGFVVLSVAKDPYQQASTSVLSFSRSYPKSE